MRQILIPLLFGFGVTLALVIGSRLTADAMAVVLGVAVGVAASVPTSILLVALVRWEKSDSGHTSAEEPETHRVVIEPPPAPKQLPARRP